MDPPVRFRFGVASALVLYVAARASSATGQRYAPTLPIKPSPLIPNRSETHDLISERFQGGEVEPVFEALQSPMRSPTRILFPYLIPCMHSFGSMTPRFLTILNLP